MEAVAEKLLAGYVRPGEGGRLLRQRRLKAAVHSGSASLFLARRGVRASIASGQRSTLTSARGHLDLHVEASGPGTGDDPDDSRFEEVRGPYAAVVPGYVRRVYIPWAAAAKKSLRSLSSAGVRGDPAAHDKAKLPAAVAAQPQDTDGIASVPDLSGGPPAVRLPSRVVYIASCARLACPSVPLPQVVYGLDASILSLRERKLEDADALHLAIALRDGWSRCVALDVSECRLSDWAVAALLDSLLVNDDVRALDISGNTLGPRGQHAVLRLLSCSARLRHINVARCGLDDGFLSSLFDVLCARRDRKGPSRSVPPLRWGPGVGRGEEADGDASGDDESGGAAGASRRLPSRGKTARGGARSQPAHGTRAATVTKTLAVIQAVTREARESEVRAQREMGASLTPSMSTTAMGRGATGTASSRRVAGATASVPALPVSSLLHGPPSTLAGPARQAHSAAHHGKRQPRPRATGYTAMRKGPDDGEAGEPPAPVVESLADPIRILVALASPILPLKPAEGAHAELPELPTGTSTPRSTASTAASSLLPTPRTPLLAAAHKVPGGRLAVLEEGSDPSHASLPSQLSVSSLLTPSRRIRTSTGATTLRAAAKRGLPPVRAVTEPGSEVKFVASERKRRRKRSHFRLAIPTPAAADKSSGASRAARAGERRRPGDLQLPTPAREALSACLGGSASIADASRRPPPTCVAALGPYHGDVPLLADGNRTLRSVVLAGNSDITAASTAKLAHMIGVDFESRQARPASMLEDLCLAWCPLGGASRQIILSLAMPPQRLTSLDLSFVGMDDTSDPALPAALREAIASSGSLRRLDVSHNELGPRSARAIAEALTINETVRALLVGFNPFGVTGGGDVILAALVHPRLRELGLENCSVLGSSAGHAKGKPHLWGESAAQALFDRAWRVKKLKEGMLVATEWPPAPRAFAATPDEELASVLRLPDAAKPSAGTLAAATSQVLFKGMKDPSSPGWPLSIPHDAVPTALMLLKVPTEGGDSPTVLEGVARRSSAAAVPAHARKRTTTSLSLPTLPTLHRSPTAADAALATSRLMFPTDAASKALHSRRLGVLDPLEWSVETSIFSTRPRECDSGDFVDSRTHLSEAFATDWEGNKIYRFIRTEPAMDEIRHLLSEAYPLLREAYRAYGLRNGATDPFDLSFTELRELWNDMGLFEALNVDRSLQEATLIICFSASNYSTSPGSFETSASLTRPEFLEVIARLAIQTLIKEADRFDPEAQAKAVGRMLKELLLPQLRRALNTRSSALALLAAESDSVSLVGMPGQPITPGGARVGADPKLRSRRPKDTRHKAKLEPPRPPKADDVEGPTFEVREQMVQDPYQDGSGVADGVGDDGNGSEGEASEATPSPATATTLFPSSPSGSPPSASLWLLKPSDTALPGYDFDTRKYALRRLAIVRAEAFGLLKKDSDEGRKMDVATVAVAAAGMRRARRSRKLAAATPPPITPSPAPLWAGESDIVSNAFRKLWLLREDVAILLQGHRGTLNAAFRTYSGRWSHTDDGRRFVSLSEWLDLMSDANLTPDLVDDKMGVAAYIWSATTVRDESQQALDAVRTAHRRTGKQLVDRYDQHTRSEFLESISRLAGASEGTGLDEAARTDSEIRDEVLYVASRVRKRITRRRERAHAREAARLDDATQQEGRLPHSERKHTEAVGVALGTGRTEGAGDLLVHARTPSPLPPTVTGAKLAGLESRDPSEEPGTLIREEEGDHDPMKAAEATRRRSSGTQRSGAGGAKRDRAQAPTPPARRSAIVVVEEEQQAAEAHPQRETHLAYLSRLAFILRRLSEAVQLRIQARRRPTALPSTTKQSASALLRATLASRYAAASE